MRKLSRRRFLELGALAAVAGAGAAIAGVGCGRKAGRDDDGADGNATVTGATRGQTRAEPSYVALHKSGELRARGQKLWGIMERCRLCPRNCGVNRIKGETGFCRASAQLRIASHHPHFGEEAPLVGRGGSGTIFFSHCGLRCIFCINWDVSHEGRGTARSIEELASMMLGLQGMGCSNINVVTPTHYSPHIVLALDNAAGKGLRLPLLYNTCGWEEMEVLKTLDGIVDIYLPDFKYADGEMAGKYSAGAISYPDLTKRTLMEMYRQVGGAKQDSDRLIRRGLMIRHLVMPNRVAGTKEVVEWIAENLPKDTYLNLMSQYTPVYRAPEFEEISRPITRKEYAEAVEWARSAGLTNLEIQGYPLL